MLLPLPDQRKTRIVVGTRVVEMTSEYFALHGKLPSFPESNECWPWGGFITPNGYGKCYTAKGRGATATTAHRVAYQLFVGEIPKGLVIDHLCNTKSCVNPNHLKATTNRANVFRAVVTLACPKGHPYTPDNIYRHGKRKVKVCRTCGQLRGLMYYREHYSKVRSERRRNAVAAAS